MKAAVIQHRGDAGSLQEVAQPEPGAEDVLVRVTAAGVNPIDWKIRDRGERPMPFVLGQDFAGVVSATGERAHAYRQGERVFGIARDHGAFAEYTVVPENDRTQPIAKIPDGVADADAAALPTAGLTALAALDVLRVERGTLLLVVGATGGVGSFALQIARDRGAHVIAVASAANEALARSLGAETFVAYDRGDPIEAVKSAHRSGVDAVLDLISGPDEIGRMADAMRGGARIVSPIGAADVEWFAQRKLLAENIVMANTPVSSHDGLRTLAQMLERGSLRIQLAAERPLAQAPEALAQSKEGRVDGKLVLTVAS